MLGRSNLTPHFLRQQAQPGGRAERKFAMAAIVKLFPLSTARDGGYLFNLSFPAISSHWDIYLASGKI